jgi:hypothetical protein
VYGVDCQHAESGMGATVQYREEVSRSGPALVQTGADSDPGPMKL